jgi:NADH-quinone oxidoreductase subunit N
MIVFGSHDWSAVSPVLTVALTALLVLVADLCVPKRVRRSTALVVAALGSIAAQVLAGLQYHALQTDGSSASASAFAGAFFADGFTIVVEAIIILAVLFTLGTAYGLGREDQGAGGIALLLWSASGAMLAAGAGDLMTIFLGIELASLALYCLCAFASRATARESALKYLILSSTASGFMLYGMALLFGATGSVALAALSAPPASHAFFTLGIGLFFVGLAFKLSLVPFHVWAPDVYEGAPLPVTAFMSVVVKAAVLAVLGRVIYGALPKTDMEALLLPLWIAAALSMIAGNAAALAQTDMKRLLAYSGIAQVGYIVAAFAGVGSMGLRYALFYLTAYMFMNLGVFAVLALLCHHDDEGSALSAFEGLGHRKPVLAALMTFFLLSLAGLPPTAGFTGKILLLASMVNAGYAWLAVVLVIGTAISIYAYIKIVRAMYVRTVRAPQARPLAAPVPLPWLGVIACAVAVLALGLYPFFPSNVLPLVK